MDREELAGWLRLALTPGVGNSSARKLLAAFGLPDAIFRQKQLALSQVVSQNQAGALLCEPAELAAQLDITWAWLHGSTLNEAQPEWRHIAVLGDGGYPAALLNMEDPPLMLYLLGARRFITNRAVAPVDVEPLVIDLIAKSLSRSIAIVGSRNPTPQGKCNAREFGRALSAAGLTVVSGLALGVDGAAHTGALDGLTDPGGTLPTIAVVGTGLDRVYPQSHRALAHRIADHGLILSEYLLGTPPLAANFPRRNRLIAGLTQGTLVIEAALASGSLITARLASEQGKDVFAIPGSIHSMQSRGCHALIKQGAKLVECTQDVLDELDSGVTPFSIAQSLEETGASVLNDDENGVLEALGYDPVGLDALQARTGIDIAGLQVLLMTLELDGRVARLPGGLFQRMAIA